MGRKITIELKTRIIKMIVDGVKIVDISERTGFRPNTIIDIKKEFGLYVGPSRRKKKED